MYINRENKICKIIAIMCVAAIALTVLFGINNLSTFQLINMVSCAAIAAVCFKDFKKDREFFLGVYSLLAVYQVIALLISEGTAIFGILVVLGIFLGYAAIVAYFMKWIEAKNTVFLISIVVCVLRLYSIVPVVTAYRNLTSLAGGMMVPSYSMIGKTAVLVATYAVPALAMALLIKTNAIVKTEE